MSNDDAKIIEAMMRFGGSFASALGFAARKADQDNLQKIKQAFPELLSFYAMMAKLET